MSDIFKALDDSRDQAAELIRAEINGQVFTFYVMMPEADAEFAILQNSDLSELEKYTIYQYIHLFDAEKRPLIYHRENGKPVFDTAKAAKLNQAIRQNQAWGKVFDAAMDKIRPDIKAERAKEATPENPITEVGGESKLN